MIYFLVAEIREFQGIKRSADNLSHCPVKRLQTTDGNIPPVLRLIYLIFNMMSYYSSAGLSEPWMWIFVSHEEEYLCILIIVFVFWSLLVSILPM